MKIYLRNQNLRSQDVRLLTSKACRKVVAEVCAAAYSVMPLPGRAARTDSDQVRTVRLAAKTRMTDKSKQKLTHFEYRFMFDHACP